VALVGGGRRAVLEQQLLGGALVHTAAGGQVEGGEERVAVHPAASDSTASQATTSKSLMPANSPFMAWVPPG
jgi:hypothetical protein